jgi:hypothetical protein
MSKYLNNPHLLGRTTDDVDSFYNNFGTGRTEKEKQLAIEQDDAEKQALYNLKARAKHGANPDSSRAFKEAANAQAATNFYRQYNIDATSGTQMSTRGGDVVGSQPSGLSDASGSTSAWSAIAGAGGKLVEESGDGEDAATVGGSALSGAGQGATMGAPAGPYGAAIGAGIGAVVGTVGGLAKIKANRRARIAKAKEKSFREIAQIQENLADKKGKAFKNLMSVMQQAFLGGRR